MRCISDVWISECTVPRLWRASALLGLENLHACGTLIQESPFQLVIVFDSILLQNDRGKFECRFLMVEVQGGTIIIEDNR